MGLNLTHCRGRTGEDLASWMPRDASLLLFAKPVSTVTPQFSEPSHVFPTHFFFPPVTRAHFYSVQSKSKIIKSVLLFRMLQKPSCLDQVSGDSVATLLTVPSEGPTHKFFILRTHPLSVCLHSSSLQIGFPSASHFLLPGGFWSLLSLS